MQQIVAACARRAVAGRRPLRARSRARYPYRDLPREIFEELLELLSDGIASRRGRYGAYLLRDRIHGACRHAAARARRPSPAAAPSRTPPSSPSSSSPTAPDRHPRRRLRHRVLAGDVILLGNASWRIAASKPPAACSSKTPTASRPPFPSGAAKPRSAPRSSRHWGWICARRSPTAARTCLPRATSPDQSTVADTVTWLKEECGVNDAGAEQLIAYIVPAAPSRHRPHHNTIVAERFFDEGGGMQLIIHAPFGGRINKAWGLALRKRFCRGFNFELQAAATDNGLNISLAEQHSFPLADVFQFLQPDTVQDGSRAGRARLADLQNALALGRDRALALLRFQGGKKVPPQIQRMRGEDLLASVFPMSPPARRTSKATSRSPIIRSSTKS